MTLCAAAGTVAYMAPEVLQMGSLSMAADVYSFAMIMLELWTGEAIYKDLPAHQARCTSCLSCKDSCAPHFLEARSAAEQACAEAVGMPLMAHDSLPDHQAQSTKPVLLC